MSELTAARLSNEKSMLGIVQLIAREESPARLARLQQAHAIELEIAGILVGCDNDFQYEVVGPIVDKLVRDGTTILKSMLGR